MNTWIGNSNILLSSVPFFRRTTGWSRRCSVTRNSPYLLPITLGSPGEDISEIPWRCSKVYRGYKYCRNFADRQVTDWMISFFGYRTNWWLNKTLTSHWLDNSISRLLDNSTNHWFDSSWSHWLDNSTGLWLDNPAIASYQLNNT